MSISSNQLYDACRIVSKAIWSLPDLNDHARLDLERKVDRIAKTVLPEALKQLGAEDFPSDKDSIPFLVHAIENEILRGYPEELAEKINTLTTNLSLNATKTVRFDSNKEEENRERLKAYSKRIDEKLWKETEKNWEIQSFQELISDEITFKRLSAAFEREIWFEYQKLYGVPLRKDGKMFPEVSQAIAFYKKNFELALDAVIESGEKETDKVFRIFADKFQIENRKVQYREKITREIFRDLLGKRKSDILDLKDPYIKQLLKEYDEGTWKDGEKRTLIMNYITIEEIKKFGKVFYNTLRTSEFKNALSTFANNQ